MKSIRFITLLILLLLSNQLLSKEGSDSPPIAQKGILDLRNWDLEKYPVIKLDGEWELYWNQLLTPKDFNPPRRAADAYAIVPKYWSSVKEKDLPKQGYATYRLIILSDKELDGLMLYIPVVNTSMKVWWNGKLLGETGHISKNVEKAQPSLYSIKREVELKVPRNELIVQIENFHHREGGFFFSPVLGKTDDVLRNHDLYLIINVFLFGSLIIMLFYHLGLFLMRKQNYAALAFSIFSAVLALRILVIDTEFLTAVLPNISFDWKYRLEYLTFFFIPPSFTFYIYQVTKDKFSKKFLYFLLASALIFSISLFAKPIFFTKLMPYYQPFNFLMIIIITFIVVKHTIKRTPGADILALTFLIVAFCIINDILYYLRIIDTISLTPLAILVLILGQSLVLAKIFTKAFEHNEILMKELEYQKTHLEDLVKERTKEIERQKKQLEKQNQLLKEQSETLEIKDQLITSSLQYAATILRNILPDKNILNKYYDNFLLYMPKDIVSGDGYWFYDKHPQYLFIAVYDCTGHGVPAAFMNILAFYLLRTTIREKQILEPNEALERIDKELKQILARQGHEGMELLIARFEKNDEQPLVKIASAKLELFYYNSKTRIVTRYRGTRRALGYASSEANKESFTNFMISFRPNDVIYITTDGYIDQVNKNRKRFGTEKFIELIQKIGDLPMQQQLQILKETIIDYMADTQQRDDITILGIKNAPYTAQNNTNDINNNSQ